MKRLSVVGLVLASLYTLFSLCALGVYLTYRHEDALAGLFMIIAAIPWSLFALDLLHIPAEGPSMIALGVFCVINALLLYALGWGIGRLFTRTPQVAAETPTSD